MGIARRPRKPWPGRQSLDDHHHFRDEGLRRPGDAPFDHVVIFDEAQRAWNREKTSDFMKRRKKIRDFSQSEPEFLISYLDRHEAMPIACCLRARGKAW